MVSCTCSLDEQAICQGWQDSNLSWLNEVHLRVPTRSPTAVLYNHLNPSLSENPSSGHAAPLAQVAPQGHACKLTDVAGIFFLGGRSPRSPLCPRENFGKHSLPTDAMPKHLLIRHGHRGIRQISRRNARSGTRDDHP